MSAPSHDADIVAIFQGAGLQPREETATDEGRRANLQALIVALNAHDQTTEWGVLVKTDQGGKIPADVAVWRSTREHFDVLRGDSGAPTWQPSGIVPSDRWIWQAVGGAAPPVGPGQPIPPGTGDGQAASGGVLDQNLDQHAIPGSAGRALLDMNTRSVVIYDVAQEQHALFARIEALMAQVSALLATHTAGQEGTISSLGGQPIAAFALKPRTPGGV